MTKPVRAIVNYVTSDDRYLAGMARLRLSCARFALDVRHEFYGPHSISRSVPHSGPGMVQYGFKPVSIATAMFLPSESIIWCDASVVLTGDPTPAFEFVEEHGHAFAHSGFSVADWTSDRCLAALGMSRKEAKSVPMIAAICLGFDARRRKVNEMLRQWETLALDKALGPACFNGSHRNDPVGTVSDDPACRGHRHDQSVLSILAHRYGLQINHWPHFAYATPEGKSPRDGVCLLGKGC